MFGRLSVLTNVHIACTNGSYSSMRMENVYSSTAARGPFLRHCVKRVSIKYAGWSTSSHRVPAPTLPVVRNNLVATVSHIIPHATTPTRVPRRMAAAPPAGAVPLSVHEY